MPAYRAKPPKGAMLNRADKLARGLAFGFLLNEGNGPRVEDAVGKNHGTSTSTWVGGPFGKCLRFLSGKITLSSNVTLSGSKTVSFFLNATAGLNAMILGGANGNYYPYCDTTTLYISTAPGVFTAIGSHGMAIGSWYHVCISGTGSTATAYINGRSIGSGADRSPTISTIGSRDDGGFQLNGLLDVPLIYNQAFSAAEVRDLYADPFRMWRRRAIPVPVKPSAAAFNRRRRIILGAAA